MKKLMIGILLISCALLVLVSVPAVRAESEGVRQARELLYEGILSHAEEIDVSSCGITPDECQKMLSGFFDIYPYAFVANRYNTSYLYRGDTVLTIKPNYLFSADEAKAAIEYVEKKIDAVVSRINASWSDAEKLLYIHDYTALNFEYDTSFGSTDVYTFFKNKKGTCNAYSMTLIALCGKLGIPCALVSSEKMYHSWVRVQVDGEWYHIDVTHDDAIPDKLGRVSHDQFLVSDKKIAGIADDPHEDFETGLCTSEKYDGAFWTESSSNVVYLGGKWYFAASEKNEIHSGSFSSLSSEKIHEFETVWTTADGLWPGCYSGIIAENGRLLYNKEKEIVELDPSSGETRSVLSIADGQIYGLFRDDSGDLCWVKASDPNGSNQSKNTFEVPEAPSEFRIRFLNSGAVFASYTVKKGDHIPCPESEPIKRSDDKARYEFSYWSGYDPGLKATENRDFEAVFSTIPFTAPRTSKIPSTTKRQTSKTTSAKVPASTVPASSATSSATPSSSVSETSTPQTEVPFSPADSTPAPGSTRDQSGPNAPSADYSGNPEVTHDLPIKGNASYDGSADDPVMTASGSTGFSGEGGDQPSGFEKALPFIVAGAGGVVVVGSIVVIEKIIMPKRREKKAPSDNETDQKI